MREEWGKKGRKGPKDAPKENEFAQKMSTNGNCSAPGLVVG
jgi:hypothetical protein